MQVFLFHIITAVGVVPSGGRTKASRTSSIVRIISCIWSFDNSKGILSSNRDMFLATLCYFYPTLNLCRFVDRLSSLTFLNCRMSFLALIAS